MVRTVGVFLSCILFFDDRECREKKIQSTCVQDCTTTSQKLSHEFFSTTANNLFILIVFKMKRHCTRKYIDMLILQSKFHVFAIIRHGIIVDNWLCGANVTFGAILKRHHATQIFAFVYV